MLAGSLTEFAIPDIFSLLSATKKTGVLNLAGPTHRGQVWIQGGAIAYAVADVTRSPLAARLLHGGEANPEGAERLIEAQASGDPGAVALSLADCGIGMERVRTLMHDQVVDAVFDLSQWGTGTFAFDQGAPVLDVSVIPLVAAEQVLETVSMRLHEWDTLSDRLPHPSTVLATVSRPSAVGGTIQVDAAQWEVLTLVDGLRTLADITDLTGLGRFNTARMIVGLVAAGLVEQTDHAGLETVSQARARLLAEAEEHLLGAAPRALQAPPSGGLARPAPLGNITDAVTDLLPTEPAAQAQSEPYGSEIHVADVPADESDHYDEVSLDEPAEDGGQVVDFPTTGAEERIIDPATLVMGDRPAEPAAGAEDAERERREREMAALGITSDESAPEADEADEGDRVPAEQPSASSELLARLINGVKGA